MAIQGKGAIEPILVGYAAKKVEKQPEWLEAAGVQEICSVSGCISAGLSDAAFQKWLHNGLCLYDDEATLESLLAEVQDSEGYGIFALVPPVTRTTRPLSMVRSMAGSLGSEGGRPYVQIDDARGRGDAEHSLVAA